jgi:hypothetical protein
MCTTISLLLTNIENDLFAYCIILGALKMTSGKLFAPF